MHLAPLIRDLAVILGVAAVVTFLFRRIKQPVVLGYIIAGLIVGPFTPTLFSITSVSDRPSVAVWAELGVIFLMFTVGLEFSFRKMARDGITSVLAAAIEISFMIFVGFECGELLGWPRMDSLFLGCMLAISSTTIIVKTVEELGMKSRRFVEGVFGILIIEDLAAILILVALSSVAIKHSFGGWELAQTAGKLAFVVAVWVLVGLFVVPRFIRSVGRHGNDEMLVVVSLGLCLSLVAISASLNYSVALGAFIMGSILAESTESRRIEHLVRPLRDVFGAVFFVTVGMMIDPRLLLANIGTIIAITATLMIGKIVALTFGSLATGRSLAHSVQTGFSMAQIGEFSFVIATLGQTSGIISKSVYPVIVAVSILTTFTTPYMIRASEKVGPALERRLPPRWRDVLAAYQGWVERRQADASAGDAVRRGAVRWASSVIVVILVFTVIGGFVRPWIRDFITDPLAAALAGWGAAIAAAAPFIWQMLSAFRATRNDDTRTGLPGLSLLFVSRLATILVVGILSMEFFVTSIALLLTVLVSGVFYLAFSKQLDGSYAWFESQFKDNIHKPETGGGVSAGLPHHLAPFNARLAQIKLHADAPLCGKRLIDAGLRESYGVNVVAIQRGTRTIVAPMAHELLFPEDQLLVLGEEEKIESLRPELERPKASVPLEGGSGLEAYKLRQLQLAQGSPLVGRTIKDARIREDYGCLVVGVDRAGEQILNPKSDLTLAVGDRLWLVGSVEALRPLPGLMSEIPVRIG